MKRLVVTEEYFDRRELSALSDDLIKNWDEQPEVVLKLCIAPEMTYRVYDDFHENEIEKQPDGSFAVTTTFTEDKWVYGFLFSYGKYIEVLEPKHIRDILKSDAQEILEKYL